MSGLMFLSALALQVGGGWEATHEFTGTQDKAFFGNAFGAAGDVDRDGCADFVVGGAPRYFTQPDTKAEIYSGRTGLLLRELHSSLGPQVGHAYALAGDLNLDGYPDLVAAGGYESPGGIPGAGGFVVFSGRDGGELIVVPGTLISERFGLAVASGGDMNGDGTNDIAVGTPAGLSGSSLYGDCRIFSGVDGSLLLRVDGTVQFHPFAAVVAVVGDWDGDGRDDFAVGDHEMTTANGSGSGAIWIHSGATGVILYTLEGESANDGFGFDFANAGDVDADGVTDLVVGAPGFRGGARAASGAAYVYSGRDRTLLHFFEGSSYYDEVGWAVASAGDQDGDDHADLLIGAPYRNADGIYNAGTAFVLSGRTGGVLHQFHGGDANGLLGYDVGVAGDLDGDGTDHLFLYSPEEDSGGHLRNGSLRIFAYEPYLSLSSETVSASLGGTIALDLDFPPESGSAFYQILVSGTGAGPTTLWGLQVPLTPDPWYYLSLAGNLPTGATGFSGVLSHDGQAAALLRIRPGSIPVGMIGRTLWLAAVTRSSAGAGIHSSMARSLVIQT